MELAAVILVVLLLGLVLGGINSILMDGNFAPSGVISLVFVTLSTGVLLAERSAAVSDTEIWNGKVVSKNRAHGTYEESYDCNCKVDKKGNRSCDTCHRTHYTVEWKLDTTIGTIKLGEIDSTRRSVFSRPDPKSFSRAEPGTPVSTAHMYENYVQASVQSLFFRTTDEWRDIPPYPDVIFGEYLGVHYVPYKLGGDAGASTKEWNRLVSEMLGDVGPSKQVNGIVFLTREPRQIVSKVVDRWEGLNKNDAVLFIGLDPVGDNIAWVDVQSWMSGSDFSVDLRGRIESIGTVANPKAIVDAFHESIKAKFVRRKMADFAYLKDEFSPSGFALGIIGCLFLAGGAVGVITRMRKNS